MARIHVVCDASYDDRLHLAGYAGHIYIDPNHHAVSAHKFAGVIGECVDVHQAEIFAITAGLITLRDLVEKSQLSVSQVIVHTDSVTAIQEWLMAQQGQRKHPAYTKLIDRGLHLSQQRHWETHFKHVHSHVPNELASPIEKLHNLADRNAKRVRERVAAHLLTPQLASSPYYAAILPASSRNQQEADMWYKLAQHLSEQGQQGRIFITGDRAQQSHPFFAGINDYAEQQGVNRLLLGRQYLFNPQQPINGLDLTLIRQWWSLQNQKPIPVFDGQTLHKAALASQLLFGDADPGFLGMGHLSGRLQAPSHVIYNFVEDDETNTLMPASVSGWVATLGKVVKIPYMQRLPDILQHAHAPALAATVTQPDTVDNALLETLKEIYQGYSTQLEKGQWVRLLTDAIYETLPLKNAALKEAIQRYIMISEESQPEKLLQHAIRHARKLSPEPLVPPANCDVRPETDTLQIRPPRR